VTDILKIWSERPELTQLGTLLRNVFPDDRIAIASEFVELVASALPEEVQESLFGEVLDLVLGNERREEAQSVIGYYEAEATHTRFNPDGSKVHRFTAVVPMARVLLPEVREDISTKIGIVYAGDHRLYTRPIFIEHYKSFIGWEPERIELLTPARMFGARFAAVATYALFKRGGEFGGFVLEAGMATGEPMVLYASPNGETLIRRAGYAPTPFSLSSHFYRGRAFFRGAEPDSLLVDVLPHPTSTAPIVSVAVNYASVVEVDAKWPAKLTVEAAMRVAAIAERLGKPVPGAELVAPVLAELGRALPWEMKP